MTNLPVNQVQYEALTEYSLIPKVLAPRLVQLHKSAVLDVLL